MVKNESKVKLFVYDWINEGSVKGLGSLEKLIDEFLVINRWKILRNLADSFDETRLFSIIEFELPEMKTSQQLKLALFLLPLK